MRGVAGLRGGVAPVWGLVLAMPLAVAALDPESLASILRVALGGFAGTLPWVAVAVALVAGLKASGATALVARAFAGRATRMIVLAALLGGLAPFCSCEVIPFIAALLALGAPISAIMAFWLSSPLIDPATALITAAAPALVAGLVQQGMSAGAAMAFMVAGSVSCIPAMAAVVSLVRGPVFAAYVVLGIAGALASGAAFGTVMG